MKRLWKPLVGSLVIAAACVAVVRASNNELKTLELASETVRAISALALKGVPQSVLREAAGVAVIPHVVKAGLVVDERHGRGVVLVRQADGSWSHPIFVTLDGHGIGLQAGIESTDLVLIFKTHKSLDRALQGKLTLGRDVTIAAGPLGHEVQKATNSPWLRAEICSYSRSHGLFAGMSLEGSVLHVDARANETFYNVRNCRAEDVLVRRGAGHPPVELLKVELERMGGGPLPPPAPRVR
jgi:lipid-binding SYLF domain-containing protein